MEGNGGSQAYPSQSSSIRNNYELFNLPRDLVPLGVVVKGNGEISTLIKLAKLRGARRPRNECACNGRRLGLTIRNSVVSRLSTGDFAGDFAVALDAMDGMWKWVLTTGMVLQKICFQSLSN